MPVQTVFDDDEKTIFRVIYSGRWQVQEAHLANQEGNALLDTIDHKADQIWDFTQSAGIPRDFLSFLRSTVTRGHHPNMTEVTIVAGMGGLGNTFLNLLKNVTRSPLLEPVYLVDTVDQAYAKLAEVREKRLKENLTKEKD